MQLFHGENGILTKSETAKEETEEKTAEEKLQLVLGELVTDKLTDNTYNEKDYINKKLTDNGMTPIGETIVYVDGWQFEIDRSKPKIIQALGKGELEEQIKIALSKVITSDYVSGTIKIEITYEGEITSITLNGSEINLPQKQDGKYVIEQSITNNGNYSVIAKDKEGKFNIANIQITDITEDMEIWNKEDMVAFRKKVNDEGRTFETKKAIVMDNIDLKGSDSDQWVPIDGFQGTFDGNYYTIDNLYVKSSSYSRLGLFTELNSKVVVQRTILNNVIIENTYDSGTITTMTGGIAGHSSGIINNCGINSGNISAQKTLKGSDSYARVGGIIGQGIGEINKCYNKATIKSKVPNGFGNNASAGGIAGVFKGKLLNCYNVGSVDAEGDIIRIGGFASDTSATSNTDVKFENSYNIGNIGTQSKFATTQYVGGIVASNGISETNYTATISNSYCIANTQYAYYYWNGTTPNATSTQGRIEANTLKGYTKTLGDAYTEDTNNINNGYPILKWQKDNEK